MTRRIRKFWIVLLAGGLVMVALGALLVVGPILGAFSRGHADQSALQAWNNGGSQQVAGPVRGGAADVHKGTCGSSSATDFALVTFGSPAQYHYAGVAGDGTWDLLGTRSMVHYTGTPSPGQQGNVIIAFHREPDYEHINQLNVGDKVTLQDRSCHTYVYQITQRWDLSPDKVSQLVPTSGHDLTLITCDPWWQDYNRLVWRATLVSAPAASGGSGGGASASNPAF